MISQLGAGAFLILSGCLWLLVSRPRPDWRGDHAAQFAAAIILLPTGLAVIAASLMDNSSLNDARLVLVELSRYAALPLLVVVMSTVVLRDFGWELNWDRLIWGRVLLGICVIYEVCRRSDVLDIYEIISLSIMALSGVATIIRHAQKSQFSRLELVLGTALVSTALIATLMDVMASFWVLSIASILIWLWTVQQSIYQQNKQ